MTQLTLEDAHIGTELRDAATEQVLENAGARWRADAFAAIERLARTGQGFTSEELREIVGDPPGHPNAMGATFLKAARRGLIVKQGHRNATRPSLHASELTVWIGTDF